MKKIFTLNNLHAFFSWLLAYLTSAFGFLTIVIWPLKYDYFLYVYNSDKKEEVVDMINVPIEEPSLIWWVFAYIVAYFLAEPWLKKIKIK